MEQSEDITLLAKALVALQKEMPSVKKTADNPFFKSKYAPLDKVMPQALEALSKHDLAIVQLVSHIEGQSALTTTLLHSSGQFISGTQPLVLDKENPQGQGSAITYARRYALMSAIGMVADEDDDGNRASTPRGTTAPASSRGATEKQIDWMRKTLRRKMRGSDPAMSDDAKADKTIQSIIGVLPQDVPIKAVKEAVDAIEAADGDTDDLPDITPQDIEDFNQGNLPY